MTDRSSRDHKTCRSAKLWQGRSTVALKAATLMAFGLFVLFVMSGVFTASLQYDDAYFACVAKNLARGIGYRTTHNEVRMLFNPAITTGPILLVPAAGMITIFGNKHWVPGFTTALFSIILLLAIFHLSRRMFHTAWRKWLFALASLLLLISFTSEFLGCGEDIFLRYWFLFLGEAPAALLVVTGLFLTFGPYRTRKSFFGGVLIGGAALTKINTIMSLPGVVIFLLVIIITSRRKRREYSLKTVLTIIGFIVPLLIFEVVKISTVPSVDDYQLLKHSERSHLFRGGSGIEYFQVAESRLELVRENISRNIGIISNDYFGSPVYAMAFLVLLACAVGRAMRRTTEDHNVRSAGIALVMAFLLHLMWWILAGPGGWVRHLLPGLFYVLIGLAALIAAEESRRWQISFIGILVLLIGTRVGDMQNVWPPRCSREERLKALLETADYLDGAQFDDAQLVGADNWVNVDLEYVLPSVENFRDCFALTSEEATRRLILVRSEYWNWRQIDRIEQIRAACEQHILFRRGPFVVSECTNLAPLLREGQSAGHLQ